MDKKPSGLAKANTQRFYTFKNRFCSSEGGQGGEGRLWTIHASPPLRLHPPSSTEPTASAGPRPGPALIPARPFGMFLKIPLGQPFPQPSSLFLQGEGRTKRELPRFLGFRSFSAVQQRGQSLAADSEIQRCFLITQATTFFSSLLAGTRKNTQ